MDFSSVKWVLLTGALMWALAFTFALNSIVLYRAVEKALSSCYGLCPMGIVIVVLLTPYAISRALKVEVASKANTALFVAVYSVLFAGAWIFSANSNLINYDTLKGLLTFTAGFASSFTALFMLISWVIYYRRKSSSRSQ
ncbi:MAG: hypothetical protein QXK88_05340 [Desulfurococcaceae archaeon]